MKTKPNTVIDTIVAKLRDQAGRFNPSLESAPVAVLWTDERRDWEGVLVNLKSAMPELFSLGDYKPLALPSRPGLLPAPRCRRRTWEGAQCVARREVPGSGHHHGTRRECATPSFAQHPAPT